MAKIYLMHHYESSPKVYVGQTGKTLHKRLIGHVNDQSVNKRTRWIQKRIRLGFRPDMELIEEVENNLADERERYWIAFYRETLGYDLVLNELSGGRSNFKHSQASKEKSSLSHLGKKSSPETRAKISKANLGKIMSESAKQKISQAHMGSIPWNKGQESTLENIEKSKASRSNRRYFNKNIILTIQNIEEIKDLLKSGLFTQKKIGEMYGVKLEAISAIKNGRTWKEVGIESIAKRKRKNIYVKKIGRKIAQRLTVQDVLEIRDLAKHHIYAQRKIAKIYNIDPSTVGSIISERIWKTPGIKQNSWQKGKKLTEAQKENMKLASQNGVSAKLNLQLAREIKDLLKSSLFTQLQIAKLYNIGKSTISEIKLGKAWANA